MPIEFACERCSRTLRVPDGTGGRQSQCPACQHVQRIPEAVNPEPADDRLSIPCPKCKHLLLCAPELLGTRGQCKQCQCIFTISLEPDKPLLIQPVGLVFSCPECHKLFEGREDMRGRKGKCDACQAVFTISLRKAETLQAETLQAENAAKLETRSEKKAAGRAPSPKATLTKPQVSKAPPTTAHPEKFKLPKSTKPSQPSQPSHRGLGGSTSPEAVVLSPAALQQRTGRHAADDAFETAIRFMCEQCHGLMEVPSSSAGMDTACPYCQAIQTIPARSHEAEQAGPLDSYSIADDPLADFGASPAVLQNQWATQSFSRHRSGLTIGNVFQTAFQSLFPSCLISLLHGTILVVYSLVGSGIGFGLLWMLALMRVPRETLIIAIFACAAIFGLTSVAVLAWFSASLRHMALRAVRKEPLDIIQALSPAGAYGVSVLIAFLMTLLGVLVQLPSLIGAIAPGAWGLLGLLWLLILLPTIVLLNSFFSLACFAAIDGDGAGEAIATSSRLVFKHFPVMMGVKALVWLMTLPLAVMTLGLALILPIYFNAALYNLARKS